MKKRIIAAIMVIFLMFAAGCARRPNVLKADMGEFSDEKLLETITEYTQTCENIVLEPGDEPYAVSFETDFDVEGCRVVRISATSAEDAGFELGMYIDTVVMSSCEGRSAAVNVGWWLGEQGSWVQEYPVWSYLVKLEDAFGEEHYYYFRVDYSAFLNE